MKAVIMAGGQGSRLRPLTCDLPKPMVPMANRPLMEHTVELLKTHGFMNIAVTTWYLSDVIEEHFACGNDFGVSMRYFVEDRPLGTAGSVKNAAEFLDETFVVISGDALTDFDLGQALDFHRKKQAAATLILAKVASPLEYGVVFIDEQGRIERFLEKPTWGQVFSDTVNTGIYILEPEVLDLIPRGRPYDFSNDLFPSLLESNGELYGIVGEGYWSDIGNLEEYRHAHTEVLEGRVKVAIPGHREAADAHGIWRSEDVFTHPTAVIEPPVVFGKNCRVERGAKIGPYTILGDDTVIGQYSSICRSVCWNNVHIGAQAEIKGAVICGQAKVKSKARVFEGAVVGQSSTLGTASTVRPYVKIWPNKEIDRLTKVNEDVVWTGRCSRSLFGNNGVSGAVNLELTPEFASRLGASFGALYKPEQVVLVACDGWESTRMLKRALAAGLLSSGLNVVDIGSTTLPVAVFTSVLTKCVGGIYTHQDTRVANEAAIRFVDHEGLPLGRQQERSIDNSFARGDFRRVSPEEVGNIQFATGANQVYKKAFSEQHRAVLSESVQKNISVVLGYTSPVLKFLLPDLLKTLGCEIWDLELALKPNVTPNLAMHEQALYLEQVGELVVEKGANLGVLVDGTGETALLVDNKGSLVPEELYWTLLTWALAADRSANGDEIAVPITASHTVDELAAELGLSVVRTKNSSRAVLEATSRKTQPVDDALLHPGFDALAFTAQMIALIKKTGQDLYSLISAISTKKRQKVDIAVPWQKKGTVMRQVLADTRGNRRDLTDGIKIYHEQGWALVLPDSESPVVSVYTEAPTYDEADALARLYMGEIEDIGLS
ncbi:MAG: NTP transferase domain-containing protein [Firmicutes bacterium]|nr:NTP transferase domain-containing protein [Bacillota bacterium]